jgi:uncharacterized protein YlxW (UPF0749 family)
MSGDRRPGAGPDPAEGGEVVPHPFGTGSLGERSEGEATEVQDSPGPDAGTDVPATTAAEPVADVDAPVAPADESMREDEPTAEEGPTAEDEPATGPAPATGEEATGEEATGEEATGEEATGEEATGEQQEDTAAGKSSGRRTRDPLAAALIGVLTLLLGFAFAVQVRAVGDDQKYVGAREEDLVRILDELNAREARLRDQIADQRTALQQLNSSDSQSATALEEARARAEAIGILNGTIAAQGPGLEMIIRDAGDEVRVSDIVDAIQELRGAGAETMQIDGVRVGVSTAVTGTPGDLMIDGRPITSPYEFVVIGSPQNMETALNIPGGVVQDLTRHGASVTITQSEEVTVDALRPLDTPQYASPDTGG